MKRSDPAVEVFPVRQGGWVVRDGEFLRQIYGDNEHFSKSGFTRMAAMIGEQWDVIPTELDPRRHTGFICTRDYTIGGVTFNPGDRVAMAPAGIPRPRTV